MPGELLGDSIEYLLQAPEMFAGESALNIGHLASTQKCGGTFNQLMAADMGTWTRVIRLAIREPPPRLEALSNRTRKRAILAKEPFSC